MLRVCAHSAVATILFMQETVILFSKIATRFLHAMMFSHIDDRPADLVILAVAPRKCLILPGSVLV